MQNGQVADDDHDEDDDCAGSLHMLFVVCVGVCDCFVLFCVRAANTSAIVVVGFAQLEAARRKRRANLFSFQLVGC